MSPTANHVHADELRDHWWWRPGWGTGTRFYTWYVTFEEQRELHRLVDAYQSTIERRTGFDLVPREWLHLTLQGVDHVHAVDDRAIDELVSTTRDRLAELPPITVRFDDAVVWPEAVVLPAQPASPLDAVVSALQSAVADVLGVERADDFPDGSRPHVSIAYSSTDGNASDLAADLDRILPHPVSVPIDSVELVELRRDHRMYQWRTVADVPVSARERAGTGGGGQPSTNGVNDG